MTKELINAQYYRVMINNQILYNQNKFILII